MQNTLFVQLLVGLLVGGGLGAVVTPLCQNISCAILPSRLANPEHKNVRSTHDSADPIMHNGRNSRRYGA